MHAIRSLPAALLASALVVSLVGACGRSLLDDGELLDDIGGLPDSGGDATVTPDAGDGSSDASRDAPSEADADGGPIACGPETCPNGCCAADGRCLSGTEATACGQLGGACSNCITTGFEFCDATFRTCGRATQTCDATTCGDGCCERVSAQEVRCLAGTEPAACGTGGRACARCLDNGNVCDVQARACVPPSCGPGTCAGCCNNGRCELGTDPALCGTNGQACSNCGSVGLQCVPSGDRGGTCEGQPRPCDAESCPNGCCRDGLCQGGTSASACGRGGGACIDCAATGDECEGQTCRPPSPPRCGPANCATGCCDGNGDCQAGFQNARCGSSGAVCTDCSALGTTCDTGASPRVCRPSGTCPAPYGSCPNGVTTAVPVEQNVCPRDLLLDARAACASGANSPQCAAFFQFLRTRNPACFSCLSPFNVPFSEQRGIFRCVAPFVDASCNRATGCSINCQDASCDRCSAATRDACRSDVRQGQCSSFVLQSACALTAYLGRGSFCNPLQQGNNFGRWLATVGQRYCSR